MTDSEHKYIVAFSTVPGIGPARLRLLCQYFGGYQKAWRAPELQLATVGLPKNVLAEFIGQRNKLNVDQYVDNLDKRGIKYITILDKDYPDSLKNIPDPPNILYIRSAGQKSDFCRWLGNKTVAVVGTRKMTPYGQSVTKKLVTDLVVAGCTIVSGMALGVDGIAHQTCLDLGKPTIAVLGAGVDIIYPPEHFVLYKKIVDNGAVISEVAPGKTVGRGIFPARNRIISGLSQMVLITEGSIDSGSLITAKLALDQGREVFAVPGDITSPMAQGTNQLLKEGANIVTDSSDILERLGLKVNKISMQGKPPPQGRNLIETEIIECLVEGPAEIDEISRRKKLPASEVAVAISKMEMDGLVASRGEAFFLV